MATATTEANIEVHDHEEHHEHHETFITKYIFSIDHKTIAKQFDYWNLLGNDWAAML